MKSEDQWLIDFVLTLFHLCWFWTHLSCKKFIPNQRTNDWLILFWLCFICVDFEHIYLAKKIIPNQRTNDWLTLFWLCFIYIDFGHICLAKKLIASNLNLIFPGKVCYLTYFCVSQNFRKKRCQFSQFEIS